MKLSLQKTLSNKNTLKITALFIGFLFWSIFNKMHLHSLKVKVPFCFFNIDKNYKINAPEEIFVELSGKKKTLRTIDFQNLAVHIDCEKLKKGKNQIKLSNKNLFLPKKISLVEYKPLNLLVEKF